MVVRARATSLIVLRTLFGLGFLAAIVTLGLYFFGRERRPENPAPAPLGDVPRELAIRGEGFHVEFMDGNRPVLVIDGEEQTSDRDGIVALVNVRLAAERDDGSYAIRAQRAYFDPETNEALLEGSVRLDGPRGLWLEASRLEVTEKGESLIAREGATFGVEGRVVGTADLLKAGFGSTQLELTGNVEIESSPEQARFFRLTAGQLIYNEERGFGRANNGVHLDSDGSSLSGERLHLNLDPITGEITFLRVLWDVEGTVLTNLSDPSSLPLELEGTSLTLRFDPESGQVTDLELRGTAQRPAFLHQQQDNGTLLEVRTVSLTGIFRSGVLIHTGLDGKVRMSQVSGGDDDSARTVSGDRGEARFSPQGEAVGFTIEGGVKIWDADLVATADRALIDSEKGEVELFGDPVKLTHPRGTLEAGQLRYLEDMSLIHGHGDIIAVLTESETRAALSVAGQTGPIRVIAEETFWLSEPDGVLFQGSVRAWQGEYALLADQLRGEEVEGRMSAAGGVRTLWNPPAGEEANDRSRPGSVSVEDGAEQPEPRPQGPMEVSADEMIYRQAENELSYLGSVRAEQDLSSLRCDKLDVILDEDREAERLECVGNVRIEDAETGLSFEAARALYDLQNETIDVFGDPIVIRDSEGSGADNVRELNYSFEDKVLLLRSGSGVALADDT